MKEIKLVELNRGRDYIRYEIHINGSRFVTGWIRFRDIKELKYKYEGKKGLKGHYGPIYYNTLLHPNFKSPSENEIGIKININDNWDFYITVEGCEIIKNHIKNMYNFLFRGDA